MTAPNPSPPAIPENTTPWRWCRHHEKPEPMVDKCAVGVDIEALCGPFGTMGRAYMLPCHNQGKPDIVKCECSQRSFFTDAEVAEQERERAEWTAAAIERINKTAKPRCPYQGEVWAPEYITGGQWNPRVPCGELGQLCPACVRDSTRNR